MVFSAGLGSPALRQPGMAAATGRVNLAQTAQRAKFVPVSL